MLARQQHEQEFVSFAASARAFRQGAKNTSSPLSPAYSISKPELNNPGLQRTASMDPIMGFSTSAGLREFKSTSSIVMRRQTTLLFGAICLHVPAAQAPVRIVRSCRKRSPDRDKPIKANELAPDNNEELWTVNFSANGGIILQSRVGLAHPIILLTSIHLLDVSSLLKDILVSVV